MLWPFTMHAVAKVASAATAAAATRLREAHTRQRKRKRCPWHGVRFEWWTPA